MACWDCVAGYRRRPCEMCPASISIAQARLFPPSALGLQFIIIFNTTIIPPPGSTTKLRAITNNGKSRKRVKRKLFIDRNQKRQDNNKKFDIWVWEKKKKSDTFPGTACWFFQLLFFVTVQRRHTVKESEIFKIKRKNISTKGNWWWIYFRVRVLTGWRRRDALSRGVSAQTIFGHRDVAFSIVLL